MGPWTVHNVLFETEKSTFAVTVHWTVTAFCKTREKKKKKKKKKQTQKANGGGNVNPNRGKVHCSCKSPIYETHNHFIQKKKNLTILFLYLKIILLQYFQFLIFNKISCIQIDLKKKVQESSRQLSWNFPRVHYGAYKSSYVDKNFHIHNIPNWKEITLLLLVDHKSFDRYT